MEKAKKVYAKDAKRKNKYLDKQSWTNIWDGMRIDWDVPIKMDDGAMSTARSKTVSTRSS
ncbi:MAG: hypothetical protein O3C49_08435 [Proteobacteria bacterium]|nr:hypothetical protein [Pseudomonadota bacterium]